MTEHNPTWSEDTYYSDDELKKDDKDFDPRGQDAADRGYWDYKDK